MATSPEPKPRKESLTRAEKFATRWTPDIFAAYTVGGVKKAYEYFREMRGVDVAKLPHYQQEELKVIAARAKELTYLAERKVKAITDPTKRYIISGKPEAKLDEPSSTNSYKRINGDGGVFAVVDGLKNPDDADESDEAAQTLAELLQDKLGEIPNSVNNANDLAAAKQEMQKALRYSVDGVRPNTTIAVVKMIQLWNGKKVALVGNLGDAKVFIKSAEDGSSRALDLRSDDIEQVEEYRLDPDETIELHNRNGSKALTIELTDIFAGDIAKAKAKYEEMLTTDGETLLVPVDVILQDAFKEIVRDNKDNLRSRFITYFKTKLEAGEDISKDESYWKAAGAEDWLEQAKVYLPNEAELLEKQAGKTLQVWRDAYQDYFATGKVAVLPAEKPDQIAALQALYNQFDYKGKFDLLRTTLQQAETAYTETLSKATASYSRRKDSAEAMAEYQRDDRAHYVAKQEREAAKVELDNFLIEHKTNISDVGFSINLESEKMRIWLRAMARKGGAKTAEQYRKFEPIADWLKDYEKVTRLDTTSLNASTIKMHQDWLDHSMSETAKTKSAILAKEKGAALTPEQEQALTYVDVEKILHNTELATALMHVLQTLFAEKTPTKKELLKDPAVVDLAKKFDLPIETIVQVIVQQLEIFQRQVALAEFATRDAKAAWKKSALYVGASAAALGMSWLGGPMLGIPVSALTLAHRFYDTSVTTKKQTKKRADITKAKQAELKASMLTIVGQDYAAMEKNAPACGALENLAAALSVVKRENVQGRMPSAQELSKTIYENLVKRYLNTNALLTARNEAKAAYDKEKQAAKPNATEIKIAFIKLEQAQQALDAGTEDIRRLAQAQASMAQIDVESKKFEQNIPTFYKANQYVKDLLTPLGRGETDTERRHAMSRLMTFTTLGIVAGQLPVIRIGLSAYSGYRLGELVGRKVVERMDKGMDREMLSAQDVASIDISFVNNDMTALLAAHEKIKAIAYTKKFNAREKLLDQTFKKEQPFEYMKLKQVVESFDQKAQFVKAQLALYGIDQESKNMSHVAQLRQFKYGVRIFSGIAGGVLGGLLGNELVEHAAQQLAARQSPDLASPDGTQHLAATAQPEATASVAQVSPEVAPAYPEAATTRLSDVLTNPRAIEHATVHKGEGVFAALDHSGLSQADKLQLLKTTTIEVNGQQVAIFDPSNNSQLGVEQAERLVIVPGKGVNGENILHFYDKQTGNEITGSDLGKEFYRMDLQGHRLDHVGSHSASAAEPGATHSNLTNNGTEQAGVHNNELVDSATGKRIMTHDEFIARFLREHGYSAPEVTPHEHGGLGVTLDHASYWAPQAEAAYEEYMNGVTTSGYDGDDDVVSSAPLSPVNEPIHPSSHSSGGTISEAVVRQPLPKPEPVTLPPAAEVVPASGSHSFDLDDYRNNVGDYGRFKDGLMSELANHRKISTENNLIFSERTTGGIYVDLKGMNQPPVVLDSYMYQAIQEQYLDFVAAKYDGKFESWMWPGILEKAEKLREAADNS